MQKKIAKSENLHYTCENMHKYVRFHDCPKYPFFLENLPTHTQKPGKSFKSPFAKIKPEKYVPKIYVKNSKFAKSEKYAPSMRKYAKTCTLWQKSKICAKYAGICAAHISPPLHIADRLLATRPNLQLKMKS